MHASRTSLFLSLAALGVVGLLSPASQAAPKDLWQYAQMLYQSGKVVQAREILQKLNTDKKCSPEVPCLLASSYLLNEMDVSEEDLKRSDNLAQEALGKDPGWGNAFKIRGQIANVRGDYKEAVYFCNAALKATTPDPRAYLQRALAYQSLGQNDKALSDIDVYVKKYDGSADMLCLKASILKDLKRFDEAIAAYKQSQKVQYRDWTVYRLVECYERTGKRKEALAELKTLVQKNPRDAEAHYKQALQEEALGMNEEAIKSVTEAINNEPTPLFYRMRAGLYKKTNQMDKARADFRKSK